MHSIKLIDAHFWLHTLGVVFYIVSMWIAGITQGLMWRATNSDGTLTYSFVESLVATYPYYLGRFFGGVLVLAGMVRSEEPTSELQSLMRISYAVFCLKTKTTNLS